MKKTIVVLALAAFMAAVIGCASNSSRGSQNSEADRLIWEGAYYFGQFEEYKKQRESDLQQLLNQDPDRYVLRQRAPTQGSSSGSAVQIRQPDWVRNERPSEQDIDKAIAALEKARTLIPSGKYKWVPPPVATPYTNLTTSGRRRNSNKVEIDINARLTQSRNEKNNWLTVAKPRLEQQAAAEQQAQKAFQRAHEHLMAWRYAEAIDDYEAALSSGGLNSSQTKDAQTILAALRELYIARPMVETVFRLRL